MSRLEEIISLLCTKVGECDDAVKLMLRELTDILYPDRPESESFCISVADFSRFELMTDDLVEHFKTAPRDKPFHQAMYLDAVYGEDKEAIVEDEPLAELLKCMLALRCPKTKYKTLVVIGQSGKSDYDEARERMIIACSVLMETTQIIETFSSCPCSPMLQAIRTRKLKDFFSTRPPPKNIQNHGQYFTWE